MKCRQHVLLMDTSGSFSLALRLPTKNYEPRKPPESKSKRQYLNAYRQQHKKERAVYGRQYYLSHKADWKRRYEQNKKHILDQQKHYRNRNNRK